MLLAMFMLMLMMMIMLSLMMLVVMILVFPFDRVRAMSSHPAMHPPSSVSDMLRLAGSSLGEGRVVRSSRPSDVWAVPRRES